MFPIRMMSVVALSLAATPAPAQVAIPAAQQTITLYSYGYGPGTVRLTAGVPVTINLVNRSNAGHDFTARSFFATSRIIAGRVENGEVEVPGGQTRSVTLVPIAGTYAVHCGHPFHKMLGMRGQIIVR